MSESSNNNQPTTPESSVATEANAREEKIKVLALYKFTSIPKPEIKTLQTEIDTHLRSCKAKGTILLAEEGINGTICYPNPLKEEQDKVVEFLQSHKYFRGLRTRASYVGDYIFHRLKIKVKDEIVTMEEESTGVGGTKSNEIMNNENETTKTAYACNIDPASVVGTYVPPNHKWDELLRDPDVVVIDTRNKYEVAIGTFHNAISPHTDNFRQFPNWLRRFAKKCKEVDQNKDSLEEEKQCVVNNPNNVFDTTDPTDTTVMADNTKNDCRTTEPVPESSMPVISKKPKAIAMFCTGGIRCEKSTSYALAANLFKHSSPEDDANSTNNNESNNNNSSADDNFSNIDTPIYHLDGGILAYLDTHPDEKKSLWKGECFVFDERVAVTHGLKPSSKYKKCHACRRVISQDTKVSGDSKNDGNIHCKYCKDELTEAKSERCKERQRQIELAKKRGVVHIHDAKEIAFEKEKKHRV
eukprot:CAMPEP_0178979152 /NCGR_PEP_ID=MMETSP0789-20121207/25651_1 /TAXON_ID=3005 /ORGANISM="Rhizosolenia setigera, Strain CCMP 1694" /LENGTH=469 /DNA_ID=CAMNT_0020669161 /DNA_START=45 /DNA_END=1454 /DNA_ORIENTATION=-